MDAKSLGKLAAQTENEKESSDLIDSAELALKVEIKTKKEKLEIETKILAAIERELLIEIAKHGNPFLEQIVTQYRHSIMLILFMLIPIFGEIYFLHYTLMIFGLGNNATFLISLAIVILGLETIDFYLKSYRAKYPESDKTIFILLGCCSLIMIFLLFLNLSTIRGEVFSMQAVNISNNPDEIIKRSKAFYSKNSFDLLMGLLTLSFLICGQI